MQLANLIRYSFAGGNQQLWVPGGPESDGLGKYRRFAVGESQPVQYLRPGTEGGEPEPRYGGCVLVHHGQLFVERQSADKIIDTLSEGAV